MTFSKYSHFFFKELIKNKVKIIKVFSTIFISLLIFSSVTILKNSIENGVEDNSRVLLGGDLEISKKNKSLDISNLQILKKSFFVTEIIEFTSILRNKSKKSKTTRIKVIDKFYPLVGKAKVEPSNSIEILKNRSDTILIDEEIKNSLDLVIGDKIRIQNTSFEVIGVIKSLPDIGGIFAFGEQALINKSSLENLKINNLGSFINFKYKIVKKDNNKRIPSSILEDKGLVIKYPKDISQNLTKAIENFIYFLSIISASALLISGIGLTNSLFSFLTSNQLKIAIFKSLGFSSQSIKLLYYLQTFVILVICSLVAYISGLFIVSLFDSTFFNILNIKLKSTFKISEYLMVQFFSIIIFVTFAKPVLDVIDKIKVADLFRNSSTHLNLSFNRKSIFEISIFLSMFIFCFCIFNVKPQKTMVFFLFFIMVSFFYYFLSKIHIVILNKIKNIQNISIRMAIKNLNTYRSLNSIVIMTMGLGTTILLFLGILSFNITKELNSSIPENAPDYFFLGVQKNELNLFTEEIYKIDNNIKLITVPMISARIESINNKKPKEIIDQENDSFWFINGERRISWSKTPPINNPIVKGEWWDLDKENNLKLSLDKKVAKDLNLQIGDSITFNIYGNSVSGIITNFRKIDYKDLNINFAILFNPKYASKIPHEYMSTVKLKDEKSVILSDLLNKLPNITYIKLSDYINKTKSFLNNLFGASILISSIVVIIGLIVISNAISVIENLKVYQNLVLRILGFEKSKIIELIIFESIILFVPIIFFSLSFSSMFSYIFVEKFLDLKWHFSFSIFFIISSLFFLVLVLTLLISNRKYLNFNAYSLLRNE